MKNNWEIIFEITSQPINFGWLAPFGIGIIFFLIYYFDKSRDIFKKYFPLVVSIFLFVMTGYLGFRNIYGYFKLKKLYRNKQYKIIEGYVRNFKPGKTKVMETHTVNNI